MGDWQRVVEAARVSIGGQRPKATDEKLLGYLWGKGHTSPFEHVTITFKVECPIFTARQIMRHRTFSYNEVSGRYSELGLGYYAPKNLYTQEGGDLLERQTHRDVVFRNVIENAETTYRYFLEAGMSREQARMILPMGTFTSFFMTGNFLNWIKFLKLRYDDHAQFEVWRIAEDICAQISETFPELWEVVKEELHATPSDMAKSRNLKRALQEDGIGRVDWEADGSAPTHSAEVPETIRSETRDRTFEGKA